MSPARKAASKAGRPSATKATAKKPMTKKAAAKKPAAKSKPAKKATRSEARPSRRSSPVALGTANGRTAAATKAASNGSATAATKEREGTREWTRYGTVCISRSLGAGGEDIGRMVADALGFRYADEEIIERAAQQAGVPREAVQAAEAKPPMIDRILKIMARMPTEQGMGVPHLMDGGTSAGYENLIAQVVRQTADEGNVVIVAHGGSIALGGRSGLLRVLVTASTSTRAQRVARARGIDTKDAEREIQNSDEQRKDYLNRIYRVRQEQPTHYDLVINTDALTGKQAAAIIAATAKG